MAKSLILTYVFWLFGGLWGLHHLYLGRDRHALVWSMFAGGYFGLGWFRDLWRIPEYVSDANEDRKYLEKLTKKMKKQHIPPLTLVRSCGQIIVADAFGYLAMAAVPVEYIPEWFLPYSSTLPVPLAVALGVHLVGNIGREEGVLWKPLLAAYITYPLYFWSTNCVFWTSLLSSTAFNYYAKKWRRTPRRHRSLCSRIFIFIFCLSIYLSLWYSWIYFNCQLTDKDGQEIKCRDAFKNFFTSPMWNEFKTVMKDVYQFAQYHGWWEVWHRLIEAADPLGETNALQILNLTAGISQDEISSQYRKLSRQWHPDRHKNPADKIAAQEKFIEIQQAYEILSNIKSKRTSLNKKAREDVNS